MNKKELLVSVNRQPKRQVKVGSVIIGQQPCLIAGPCAVESKEQLQAIASQVAQNGIQLLRGGAFKPRTSPYSFQGLGEPALVWLHQVAKELGLAVVSEMLDEQHALLFERYVDMIQIGARNMQNYALLKKVAAIGKPVLLKRGFANTVEEWLMAAEYLAVHGLNDIVLCERGSRSFEPSSRFSLDLSAALMAQHLSCLPVITDPSHACGHPWMVGKLALASLAAGLDGVMVEVGAENLDIKCDGNQALNYQELKHLSTKWHYWLNNDA